MLCNQTSSWSVTSTLLCRYENWAANFTLQCLHFSIDEFSGFSYRTRTRPGVAMEICSHVLTRAHTSHNPLRRFKIMWCNTTSHKFPKLNLSVTELQTFYSVTCKTWKLWTNETWPLVKRIKNIAALLQRILGNDSALIRSLKRDDGCSGALVFLSVRLSYLLIPTVTRMKLSGDTETGPSLCYHPAALHSGT